jgi:Holliday junction resolvasome RuvABC DNA-binding subunit
VTEIDDISKELVKNLTEYTKSVEKQVKKIQRKTARNMVDELKQTSPRSEEGGTYAEGWKSRRVGEDLVVYNKSRYFITHLLEKGHAKKGGGRMMPQVHIEPVEEKHIKEYLSSIEEAIEKG